MSRSAGSQVMASILVCTFNRAAMLSEALDSLVRQRTADGRTFEIVVVDDGSTDTTCQVVESFTTSSTISLRYVRNNHGGVAAARNTAVLHAKGFWVAFFDDDQEAEPDWLDRLLDAAEDAHADCVAGRIRVRLLEPPAAPIDGTVMKLLGENAFWADFPTEREGGRNVIPGTGNALARRSLFHEAGFFDANLTYGEDAEFFRRARRLGARIVFADDAVIYHKIPPDRLRASYLYKVAKRGASSRVADDFSDGGRLKVLLTATARLAHVCLIASPQLAYAIVVGNSSRSLGRACSLRFSMSYFGQALWLSVRPTQKPAGPTMGPATFRPARAGSRSNGTAGADE